MEYARNVISKAKHTPRILTLWDKNNMSLCRIMVEDFIKPHGQEGYDAYDLEFGIEYADQLIKEGYKYEPFFRYNLKEFIKWAKGKL